MPGRHANRRGFTLLEVLVALAILTFTIGTALSLFAAATASHKRAVDRSHSAAIAEAALADVESALGRGIPAVDIMSDPPFGAIARNWPGYEVLLDIRELPRTRDEEEAAEKMEADRQKEAEKTLSKAERERRRDPDEDLPDELLVEITVRWKAEGTMAEVFREIVTRRTHPK